MTLGNGGVPGIISIRISGKGPVYYSQSFEDCTSLGNLPNNCPEETFSDVSLLHVSMRSRLGANRNFSRILDRIRKTQLKKKAMSLALLKSTQKGNSPVAVCKRTWSPENYV